jgi:uncharacterized protein (TIGR02996 family)
MLMSLRASFLQAILAAPDDDTPRLVFADWLDEQGDDARSEFIRAQCRLARLPAGDPRRPPLNTRARELLKAHREEWLRPLRAVVPGLESQDISFARGFPSGVTFRRDEDLGHAASLAAVTPLQEVRLDLAGKRIGASGVRALAQSSHLQRLTRLDLAGNRIGDGGAWALARSRNLRALTHLNLTGNRIGSVGVLALARSENLQALTHLDLAGNYIGDAGARDLAESPYLRRLTYLDIGFDLDFFMVRLSPARGRP